MKKIIKIHLLIANCFLHFYLTAQNNWIGISNSLNAPILELELAPNKEGIILGGKFSINDSLELDGIAKWSPLSGFESLNGGSLVCPDTGCGNPTVSFKAFQNDLYVGTIDNDYQLEDFGGIARWDGQNWNSLKGKLEYDLPLGIGIGQASSFEIIQDTLYVGGNFHLVDSVKNNAIVKWDGANWHGLNFPLPYEISFVNSIYDIQLFNNELYLCGNFYVTHDNHENIDDIIKFDGNKWTHVAENPLVGINGEINNMIVYKGDLYVSGYILKSENPTIGYGIARLRNGKWEPVNLEGSHGIVLDMIVHNDLLYVAGHFKDIGGIEASNIAIYDGSSWYSLNCDIDKAITSTLVFENELYIGGHFEYIDGVYTPYFAKWNCLNNIENCGVIVSNRNIQDELKFIQIYPNPSLGKIQIDNLKESKQSLKAKILTMTGEVVKSFTFTSSIKVELEPGVYLIKVSTLDERIQTVKKVVVI